jgi:hypothetical protein
MAIVERAIQTPRQAGSNESMSMDELNKAIAEANATLRFKGPGPFKLLGLILLQIFLSIFRQS